MAYQDIQRKSSSASARFSAKAEAEVEGKSETADILGTTMTATNPELFLGRLDAFFRSDVSRDRGAFVTFRDVHGVIRAIDNPELATAHKASMMNVPDGMPLVWLLRWAGHGEAQRICGPDMMLAVCAHGNAKGWRHVLMGGTPETLSRLEANLRREMPGLNIVDCISPEFRPLSPDETAALLNRIRASEPHFIWVGLGSPKQEIWMAQHAAGFAGAISMGVGAAFDMHAGRIKRAPRWMHPLGLEWIFRIIQDPRRLVKRYSTVVPRFLFLIAYSLVRHRNLRRG